MTFSSNIFILFIILTAAIYYISSDRFKWCILLTGSMIYYMISGISYLPFLLSSIVITYLSAYSMEKYPDKNRLFLVTGLILNFMLLGVMKYTNFIIEILGDIAHMQTPSVSLLLPLGISFYTFQSSGYLIDVYKKRCQAERNIFRYALFVSFFPQIVQGPISRYSQLAGQLYEPHRWDGDRAGTAVVRIFWGFFKKMVIADWAVILVDSVYQEAVPGTVIFGAAFYMIQLYADFSGGMDVVTGVASLLGITLEENFRQPFFSRSISEFWRRWHVTLGTWFRDYIYIPLGGNRVSSIKWIRNIAVVWIITGIWHGASWNFIWWGIYFGLFVIAEKFFIGKFLKRHQVVSRIYTVFFVITGFIIFRITDLAQLRFVFAGLFAMPQVPAMDLKALIITVTGSVILFIVDLIKEWGGRKISISGRWIYSILLLLLIAVMGQTGIVRGFIYAQF